MSIQGLITPNSLTFLDDNGMPYNILSSHPNYTKLKELFKKAQQTLVTANISHILKHMIVLSDVSRVIKTQGQGKVTVEGGVVLFDGEEVHGTITDRILSGLNEGFNMTPYIKFLENLMSNPSKVAVNELYGFMEHGKMGISEDGYVLGYKKVRKDYTDCHTGKFDNHPGQSHEMPRNKVDDNRERTCSSGFHFCSFDYLSQFGNCSSNRVVMVKVNPRDVVSIPADYNNAKARCCAYTVMKELEDYSNDYLSTKSVFTNDEYGVVNENHIDEAVEDVSVSYNQNLNLPRRDSRGRFVKN